MALALWTVAPIVIGVAKVRLQSQQKNNSEHLDPTKQGRTLYNIGKDKSFRPLTKGETND